MHKITDQRSANLLDLFPNSSTDLKVALACTARNGVNIGCCSDKVIIAKTNLSKQCVQSSFIRLRERKIFLPLLVTNKFHRERWGSINFPKHFQQKDFLTKTSSPNDQDHSNSFIATIKKTNKKLSKLVLEDEDGYEYTAFCTDSDSIAFAFSIDTKITFKGSLIHRDQNSMAIWMDGKSVNYYSITK